MFLNQGVTVYTRAAEKRYGVLKYIGNISEVAALARYSLGSNHLKRFPALVGKRRTVVSTNFLISLFCLSVSSCRLLPELQDPPPCAAANSL